MDQWFISPAMKSLAGSTVGTFGYDPTGNIDYQFNSLGFRSPELTGDTSVIVVGNSVTFGIGLSQEHTFGFQTAQQLKMQYSNFAVGCYYHENHDHLINITKLVDRDSDDVFVVQINNLDRRRTEARVVDGNHPSWCVARFVDYFDQARELLKHKRTRFVYWDNIQYNLPKSIEQELLIHNKFHLDTSLADHPHTFGIKSHRAISKIISASL